MRIVVLFVLAGSLVFGGCENMLDLDGPSLDFTTVEFTGTIGPGESAKHDFTIRNDGQLTATLLSAGSAITIKMGVGVPNGSACDVLVERTYTVALMPELTGPATVGSLCVQIADDGTLTEPINYVIRVQHS